MRSDKWHLSIEYDLFKNWHVYSEHASDPMYLRHTVDFHCRSALKLLPQMTPLPKGVGPLIKPYCLTYVVWRNDWKFIKPNSKTSLMPIVSKSWWFLSHSHNASSKYLRVQLMNLEMLYKALNIYFTDSQTVVQRDSFADGWWQSHEQGKSPQTPDEQDIPKSKGWAGSCLTTKYSNHTSCKSRHHQEKHREGQRKNGPFFTSAVC